MAWNIARLTILAIAASVVILGHPDPATATESAEVTEAQAFVRKQALVFGSPIPACSIWWELPPGEVTEFHPELVDDFVARPLCAGELMVHCGNDSLAYDCWWPSNDDVDPLSLICLFVTVDLEIRLQVHEHTRLRGQRHADGVGVLDYHQVTIWHPDGQEVGLFDPDGPQDEAELVLEPGLYRILLHAAASTGEDAIEAYAGDVSVTWESAATPTRAITWGELRAYYH